MSREKIQDAAHQTVRFIKIVKDQCVREIVDFSQFKAYCEGLEHDNQLSIAKKDIHGGKIHGDISFHRLRHSSLGKELGN
jgi:hypothetical protein